MVVRSGLLILVRQIAPIAFLLSFGLSSAWMKVDANPVVCTTSLEAPDPSSSSLVPVEVTRCEPVQTTGAMIERRAYTWTAPYERGTDVIHQLTDLLGISMAGAQGNQFMGFGFPDQTIVWDSSAVRNTYQTLLEEQSPVIPWRTVDLPSGFSSSLAGQVSEDPVQEVQAPFTPVRGLW